MFVCGRQFGVFARRGFASSARRQDQWVLIAYDAADSDAPMRRLRSREAHLALQSQLKESGSNILGGAILDRPGSDERSKMIGSVIVFEADSRVDVEKLIKDDPYVKNNVWSSWEIKPFRVAIKK
ncbi:hypothetical protein BJ742DRAFT_816247 [Cladochytrium replicatum]|nr:hypothetical protein BJ742DRAFT_816247 [Cladochytrium replicatum]